MILRLKSLVQTKLIEVLKNEVNLGKTLISTKLELQQSNLQPQLHVSIKTEPVSVCDEAISKIAASKFSFPDIEQITGRDGKIIFNFNKNDFIKESLTTTSQKPQVEVDRKCILVEFSSPNIAKPFHVGHLRSTIIGNFISNLYKYLDQNVVRINYLGDWGTQFGFLKVGVDLSNMSEAEIKENPIQSLYNAYVLANKTAETNPEVRDKAREVFLQLEKGEFKELDKWKMYKKYTVDELERIYNRLGVVFDKYCWESDYGQKDIQDVIEAMKIKNIIHHEIDGKKVVKVKDRRVPIIKSDGTTLYLTRDVAALIDRYKKYNFDQIYYVVDNGQNDHFTALFDVARQMELSCAGKARHIKFGRIKGMSTRKGTVVFLKDILDEARDIMKQKQLESTTTKIDIKGNDDITSDILGISAVIINDLKQKRMKDYDFSWENALQTNGDTGIKLQYTHCRLWSLQQHVGTKEAEVCNPQLLQEPAAMKLVFEICQFQEVIQRTEESLEACILVNYLFKLCNATSRALKVLNVKNEASEDVKRQRLLLFNTARRTLEQGMKILGLQPLKEM